MFTFLSVLDICYQWKVSVIWILWAQLIGILVHTTFCVYQQLLTAMEPLKNQFVIVFPSASSRCGCRLAFFGGGGGERFVQIICSSLRINILDTAKNSSNELVYQSALQMTSYWCPFSVTKYLFYFAVQHTCDTVCTCNSTISGWEGWPFGSVSGTFFFLDNCYEIILSVYALLKCVHQCTVIEITVYTDN